MNLHLQNIEPLAKAVVQRIKLCGQILSHLHRKKKRKGTGNGDNVNVMVIVKHMQSDVFIQGYSR